MVVGIFRDDHLRKTSHREKSRGCRKETGEIIVEDRKTKHTHIHNRNKKGRVKSLKLTNLI